LTVGYYYPIINLQVKKPTKQKMLKNISAPSKSFLILFLIALFGTFFCLNLWLNAGTDLVYQDQPASHDYTKVKKTLSPEQKMEKPSVDTSGWQTYTNKNYGFSFLYQPDWKVLSAKKQGDFVLIQIDPGKKYYNFKIYINTKEFYGLTSIPMQNSSVDGVQGITANGLLFGVKNGQYFYTFDIGSSTTLQPEFQAMVESVKFQ
jgi:hypothetical protein